MAKEPIRWTLLIAANAMLWGVLGLYQATGAAPKGDKGAFAPATGQRNEIIAQLKEINAQLKEQNAFLRSGKLTVAIAEKR